MIQEEREKVWVEICKKWPNKFSDDDLSFWTRELGGYSATAILEALTEHKAKSRYVPKIQEIRHVLAGKGGAVQKRESGYRSSTARSVVACNPAMRGRPEAELILRNYRFFAFFKSRHPETNVIEFATEPIEERLPKLKDDCAVQLVQAGWQIVYATQAAEWIAAPKTDFEDYLRQIGTAIVVHEEVPVMA